MKMLPFIGIVLLATFAFNVNAQTPVPDPFWKKFDKEKPKEEPKKKKMEMSLVPSPAYCMNSNVFDVFIKEKGFEVSKFSGKSQLVANAYILFFHNETTTEFIVVRTDGKDIHCMLEYGKQNLGETIGPVKNEN
jgi:hypothetical protein